jgi:uncharacterized protein
MSNASHSITVRPSTKHALLLYGALAIVAAGFAWLWQSQNSPADFRHTAFLIGLTCGIAAQLIDGALGMGYGLSATTFLMTQGITPVAATASVHIAEAFTSAASGISHWRLGNVRTDLFKRLVLPGILGALAGVALVTSIDSQTLRPWISGYLVLLGIFVIYKVWSKRQAKARELSKRQVMPLAFVGAFVDSAGGGGWGPVVTTTLVSSGQDPRTTIGSVNAAEFFITLTSGFSFALLIGIEHWETVLGLMTGGLLVAPFAARLTSVLPTKTLTIFIGLLIITLSSFNLYKALS